MTIQAQVIVRSKKLGVLIRDARLAARMTMPECARAIGISPGILRAWEKGLRSPSLPELEIFSFALNLPMRRFWSKETSSQEAKPVKAINLPAIIGIRQRMIGALLRQAREKASISPSDFSEQSGIPRKRLKAYELGERPIPLPELEGLIGLLEEQIEMLFDQTGTIGKWMVQQKTIEDFLLLPAELQNFISKPVNLPYLELARKLSDMPTDKLRALAEDLLEITF
jgi:transcriptional regulator with XRE-family HTH domain